MLYDTPRSSKSLAEDEIKSEIVDADDTYEIPENPVWDGDVSSERTRKPEITVTESVAVAACHVENTNTFQIPKNDSSTGLSDFGSLSASSSPGYSSKFPSSLGLFSLYDTPRSSTSNLAEYIYDVPRNNDPLYENDNFSGTDEEFYVTPKISVSSMASVWDSAERLP